MKLLHTSDWHLGQRFQSNDRLQEHELALNWLIETIKSEAIDTLIVAGDIFDIGNPPNAARRLYYRFLTQLLTTSCRHVVIIGGNHDSPAMLNAPKELLSALNIYIIGMATEAVEDEIIELKDQQGKLEAVVAAVPFLRDKDLKTSVSGETGLERIAAIRAGIKAHYEQIGNVLESYAALNVPLIGTGHLYLKEVGRQEERDNIYIGDRENIAAKQFPAIFDYVALGHIHRAYNYGKVHYSGSLIPLSFSETKDEKVVKVVTFEERKSSVVLVSLPQFRRLKTVVLPFDEIKSRLLQLHKDYKDNLPVWVDVLVTDERTIPNLDIELQEFVQDLNIELLKIRTSFQPGGIAVNQPLIDLKDLQPVDIFLKKCESEGLPTEEINSLMLTFKELQNWMQEKEDKQ